MLENKEPPFSPQRLAWLAQALQVEATELSFTRLPSTSSAVWRIDAPTPRAVLRILDNAPWLAKEPDLVAHEVAALSAAERAGLPVPRCLAVAAELGFAGPGVLMAYVPGQVQVHYRVAWLKGMAQSLVQIHRYSDPDFAWRYTSWVDPSHLQMPSWGQSDLWAQALARYAQGEPAYEPVFIHRDYHPTNLLWHNGRVSAIVDWINACQGPAGIDVAHCRVNLALMAGPEVAAQFLAAYLHAGGLAYDPYWDLEAVLDCCLPSPSFYPPWQTFGLAVIPAHVLRSRLERHLAAILGWG